MKQKMFLQSVNNKKNNKFKNLRGLSSSPSPVTAAASSSLLNSISPYSSSSFSSSSLGSSSKLHLNEAKKQYLHNKTSTTTKTPLFINPNLDNSFSSTSSNDISLENIFSNNNSLTALMPLKNDSKRIKETPSSTNGFDILNGHLDNIPIDVNYSFFQQANFGSIESLNYLNQFNLMLASQQKDLSHQPQIELISNIFTSFKSIYTFVSSIYLFITISM